MRVWRCEREYEGKMIGPYSSMRMHEQPPWLQAHQNCEVHPSPSSDGLDRYSGEYGFASFEQLDAWFSADNRRELREMGFRFCVFEVDDNLVSLGGKQITFPRNHAALQEEELR